MLRKVGTIILISLIPGSFEELYFKFGQNSNRSFFTQFGIKRNFGTSRSNKSKAEDEGGKAGKVAYIGKVMRPKKLFPRVLHSTIFHTSWQVRSFKMIILSVADNIECEE